ncbi:MAG: hypothetical protein HY427_01355 [Candidatus Levybacteria bacterium]|nr:hypothetical protein [Candidatus Levybacteria bacterium]
MKFTKGLFGSFSPKVIVGAIAAVAVIGAAFYNFSSQRSELTLSSVEECNRIISPLIDKGEDIQGKLDVCKKNITLECDQKLAEVDKALSIEADWQERIKLFEERKAIADACFDAWLEGPLSFLSGDADVPLLGRGEFGESDALQVLCQNILDEFDQAISKEREFDKKWEIFQKRQSMVGWCFDEWLSGRHEEGDKRMPLLGRGELGQTETLRLVCDESINDVDEKLKTEKNYEARRSLYKLRERIVGLCFDEWLSGAYGQEDIPLLGRNDYGETSAFVADCLERIEASKNPTDIINECKKKFENGGYDKSKEPNWNTLIGGKQSQPAGKTPVVGNINNTQLHGSYEETPHRYLLKAIASDPEGGKLTFIWKINCGYFVGSTNGPQVEWRYDTPGECVDATVTVAVKDNQGLSAEKSQSVFN